MITTLQKFVHGVKPGRTQVTSGIFYPAKLEEASTRAFNVEKILLGVRATSSQAGEAHPTPIELV